MAFVTADLVAIEDAIKSGALSVRFQDGRAYTYRSLDELRRAREMVQSDIDATAGTTRPRVFRIQQTGSGY